MAMLLPLLSLLPCVLGQGNFSHLGELELVEGALLTTLATLAKEWRLTFDFLPTEFISVDGDSGGATSLLRLTSTGGNSGNHGDRIPAIFIEKDKLLIFTSINSNPNYEGVVEVPPVGEWARVEAGQREEGGRFTFYFSVNGRELVTVRNNQPRDFHDVQVFASDSHYPAQPGALRNLVVETTVEDSLPIGMIVGASVGGLCLLTLSIVLTAHYCTRRSEPARGESAVEVWESARPKSTYNDQGDYDEMDHNKTAKPAKTREERKEEAGEYEMDRDGTYLEL